MDGYFCVDSYDKDKMGIQAASMSAPVQVFAGDIGVRPLPRQRMYPLRRRRGAALEPAIRKRAVHSPLTMLALSLGGTLCPHARDSTRGWI